jgi:hypothetical protein
VLGRDLADYRRSAATRIDILAARGAGFRNDFGCQWSGCLFWLLVLDLAEVDYVMRDGAFAWHWRKATCWCSTRQWRRACACPTTPGRRWTLRSIPARSVGGPDHEVAA